MRLQRDCTPLGVVIIVSAIMMTGLIVPRSRYDGSISATVGARGILGRGVCFFPSHLAFEAGLSSSVGASRREVG